MGTQVRPSRPAVQVPPAAGPIASNNGHKPTRPTNVSAPAWRFGLILAALGLGAWSVHKWTSSDTKPFEGITATVERGDLPVVVTERGDIESSKTVEVRCE